MFGEFKAFLTKSNALALAIGVIIGIALGAVVNSLVNDIIMPPIGYVLGGVDFDSLQIVLKPAVNGDPATEVAIRWGAFVQTVIDVHHHRARRVLDRDAHAQGAGARAGRAQRRGQAVDRDPGLAAPPLTVRRPRPAMGRRENPRHRLRAAPP